MAKQNKTTAPKLDGSTIQALRDDAAYISERLDRIDAAEDKAGLNERVQVAIRLCEAKLHCKTIGVKFSDWCEENLVRPGWGFQKIRKLAAIAEKADGDRAKMKETILEQREANRLAQVESRANKAKKVSTAGGSSGDGDGDGETGSAGRTKAAETPETDAIDVLKGLPGPQRADACRSILAHTSYGVVDDVELANMLAKAGGSRFELIKALIAECDVKAQMGLMVLLGKAFNVRFEEEKLRNGSYDGELFDIPAKLQRTAPKAPSKAKATPRRRKNAAKKAA